MEILHNFDKMLTMLTIFVKIKIRMIRMSEKKPFKTSKKKKRKKDKNDWKSENHSKNYWISKFKEIAYETILTKQEKFSPMNFINPLENRRSLQSRNRKET